MSLPCLEDYYKAAQLQYLVYWYINDYEAKWKELEINQLDIPLQSLLGNTKAKTIYLEKLSTFTMVPLKIWFKECKNLKLERKARMLRWVEHDADGISSTNTVLESCLHLQESHKLDRQDFYRYLQIRHHFDRKIQIDDEADLDLVKICIDAYRGKIRNKLGSRLYSCLQHSTLHIKTKWEKEANITLTEDEWLNICQINSSTTSSGQWREF